jgi:sec-independent protein translocase protein TatA
MIGFGHLPELVMVLIFALIIFGPTRLPEVGAGLGKSLREFRKATSGVQDIAHRARSEVQDIARETLEPLQDMARETMAPLPPPRQHVVPDLVAQRALAVEDVGRPVPGPNELCQTVAMQQDEHRASAPGNHHPGDTTDKEAPTCSGSGTFSSW